MELVKDFGKLWRGALFALVISVPAWLLGKRFEVVGGPVFAILLGMALALVVPAEKGAPLAAGIKFTSKKVLQWAVILLGFGLNLAQIAQVGMTSLPIIVSTIVTSLVVAFVLCRALKIPGKISTLIGVGSSICGGSAIAATAPVIDADDEEIAQSISVIFLFNVIAALVFPTLGGILGLTNEGFGLFAGTAVNDTSSVTAARGRGGTACIPAPTRSTRPRSSSSRARSRLFPSRWRSRSGRCAWPGALPRRARAPARRRAALTSGRSSRSSSCSSCWRAW